MKKIAIPAIILAGWLLLPRPMFAAEIFFEPGANQGRRDQFRMNLFLNTKEELNAVEGRINFPPDLLEFKSIEDGGSIVTVWLERPTTLEAGQIIFSGITPGGYTGAKGLIFSMTFMIKQEGKGTFEVRDARVLQNDGQGTEAGFQPFNSQFIISKKASPIEVPFAETEDTDPPEQFRPEFGQSPDAFEGRMFLAFEAQDKGTGINHYEIKETRQKAFALFSKWTPAKSPYVLKDQKLRSYVFIKAVDLAGNAKIVTVNPQYPLDWYENYVNWTILIAVVTVALLAVKKLWGKRSFEQRV